MHAALQCSSMQSSFSACPPCCNVHPCTHHTVWLQHCQMTCNHHAQLKQRCMAYVMPMHIDRLPVHAAPSAAHGLPRPSQSLATSQMSAPDVLVLRHCGQVAHHCGVKAAVDPSKGGVAGAAELLACCQAAEAPLAAHYHLRVTGDLGQHLGSWHSRKRYWGDAGAP